MDNFYTKQARQALEEAENISKELKHSYIGTEHILAGLLAVENCAASIILQKNKVNYENVIELMESLVSPVGGIAVSERELLTPRGKNVLLFSSKYAKLNNHHGVLAVVINMVKYVFSPK